MPGPTGRLTRPNVVTTASSVWRTWKTTRRKANNSKSSAPTAMVMGLRFMSREASLLGDGGQKRRAQEAVAELFFEVQLQHFLAIGGGPDKFAGVATITGEGEEPVALGVDGRGSVVSRHLVGEEGFGGAGAGDS